MPDITLHDGRELTFDLYQIKVRDWNKLIDVENPPTRAFEYELIARTCEMTPEEIEDLPIPDYKRLTRAFFKAATTPDEDPKNAD